MVALTGAQSVRLHKNLLFNGEAGFHLRRAQDPRPRRHDEDRLSRGDHREEDQQRGAPKRVPHATAFRIALNLSINDQYFAVRKHPPPFLCSVAAQD